MSALLLNRPPVKLSAAALLAALLAAWPAIGQAQTPLSIPNFSFESPSAVGGPFNTKNTIDNWVKPAEPAYFAPVGAMFGFSWADTAGEFVATGAQTFSQNPYNNVDGVQAGYILDFPQAGIFQDAASSPSFNHAFVIGQQYTFTLGVFGNSSLTPASVLELSLYYRDTSNTTNDPLGQVVIINSTDIGYSTSTFNPSLVPPSLIDFSVSTTVGGGDAWAGKSIGIMVQDVTNPAAMTGANWDYDNARLTQQTVPEPTSAALVALGLGSVLFRRSRRQA
jgi:hypothetical protein